MPIGLHVPRPICQPVLGGHDMSTITFNEVAGGVPIGLALGTLGTGSPYAIMTLSESGGVISVSVTASSGFDLYSQTGLGLFGFNFAGPYSASGSLTVSSCVNLSTCGLTGAKGFDG